MKMLAGTNVRAVREEKKNKNSIHNVHVEPELHDVPVPHHALLAFRPEKARGLVRLYGLVLPPGMVVSQPRPD
jgi:hypothetical protein